LACIGAFQRQDIDASLRVGSFISRESLPTTARDQPGGPLIATTTTGRHIGVPGSIRRLTVGLDRPRGK
jgi:hypothetical protein